MTMATRCPACSTVFRVVPDQLRVSAGWVRCGRCGEAFNAIEALTDLDTGQPLPPPAVARGPTPSIERPPEGTIAAADQLPESLPDPVTVTDGPTSVDHEEPAPAPGTDASVDERSIAEMPRVESMAQPATRAGSPDDEPVDDQTLDDDMLRALLSRGQLVHAEAGFPPPMSVEPGLVAAGTDDLHPTIGGDDGVANHTGMPTDGDDPAAGRVPGDETAKAADDDVTTTVADPEEDVSSDGRIGPDTEPARAPLDSALDAAGDTPLALPAASPPPAPPSFLRQAERRERWQRPWVRALLGAGVVAATLVLVLQSAYAGRDWLAASVPASRPLLERACAALDCRVGDYLRIEALAVESSGLVRIEGTSLYRLSIVLRNRSALELAAPAIDLSLTDAQGRLIARRVLTMAEFGLPLRTLGPGSELPIQVSLGVGDRNVSGYTIEIFYP